jgi:hypothetical protein
MIPKLANSNKNAMNSDTKAKTPVQPETPPQSSGQQSQPRTLPYSPEATNILKSAMNSTIGPASTTISKKAEEPTLLSLSDEEIPQRIKTLRQSKEQAKLLDRMSERISRGSEECEKLIKEKSIGI